MDTPINDAADQPSHAPEMARDTLTGTYTRTFLQARLEQEAARALRYGGSFSLCLFDIDYFKSINDAYGHTRGDHILRELVERLQALIRGSDLLFRYGGDEFVLLLPETPNGPASALAQRMLD